MDYEQIYLQLYDILDNYCKQDELHEKDENSLQLSILQDKETLQYRMVIDVLHSTCVNETYMDYIATLFAFHDCLLGKTDELSNTNLIYEYYFVQRDNQNETFKQNKKIQYLFKPLIKVIDNNFCSQFVQEAKLFPIHEFSNNEGKFGQFKLFQNFFFFENYETHLNDMFNVEKIKSLREKIQIETQIKIKNQSKITHNKL